MNPCQICGARTEPGIYLCPPCIRAFEDGVDGTPDLIRTLQTTISRTDRVTTNPGRATGIPSPVNFTALERKHQLLTEIQALANRVTQLGGRGYTGTQVDKTCTYIGHHLHWFVRQPADAGRYQARLVSAYRSAISAVDQPPEMVGLGRCGAGQLGGPPCGWSLSAPKGALFVTCRECGHRWDVRERQAIAFARVADVQMYGPDLVRQLAPHLGLTMKRFEHWVARGRLHPAGVRDGRNLFRLGDVTDLLYERKR